MKVSMGGVIYDDIISCEYFKFYQVHLLLIRMLKILDSQSTVNVICNQQLLKNIRKSDGYITIHCNMG